MQDIICISDLHLCDKGPRDNFFALGEGRFYRFLDYVDREGCDLFILGDLFEWWQCNLSAVVLAYRDLIQRLNTMGARWVIGNHDNALEAFQIENFKVGGIELPRMTKKFVINRGGKRILFCHGHRADSTCCDLNPGVGTITSIISGMLEDKNKGPIKDGSVIEDNFIGTLESALNTWRWLARKHNRQKELLDNIEAYRKENKADVVVSGHTHVQGKYNNCFNCGSWCRDQDGFTRIEADGSVSMWVWNKDHAEPFDKELQ